MNRIVPATVQSTAEIQTFTPAPGGAIPLASKVSPEKEAALVRRNIIAKRAAKELKEGYYVNLGVGKFFDFLESQMECTREAEFNVKLRSIT